MNLGLGPHVAFAAQTTSCLGLSGHQEDEVDAGTSENWGSEAGACAECLTAFTGVTEV